MQTTKRQEFIKGSRQGAPFILVIGPFALLFGVVATESGLDVLQTFSMSFLVIAGASQFTALQLMNDQAPVLIVLATSLAVNLRMGMYSAMMVPHLGGASVWARALAAYSLVDQVAVIGADKFETEPELTMGHKLAFIFGSIVPIAPFWYIFTVVGALVGTQIPEAFALDFAVPITFLALIAPMVKTRAHLAAALTSVGVALVLAWMPYGTGLLIAAVAAMAVGSLVEIWLERRGAP